MAAKIVPSNLLPAARVVRARGRSLHRVLAERRPRTPGDRDLEAQLRQVRRMMELGQFAPDYESLLQRHYSAWIRPGDVVLDVGAHAGRHLEHFLALVGPTGRVIGFEPLPTQFRFLRHKFDAPNLELHKVALGQRGGRTTFVHAKGAPEESGLRQRVYNDGSRVQPENITVKIRRLDQYTADLKRLDWLKVDVEGGEIGCLRGAKQTLARLRPIVSVEYGEPAYSVYGHSATTLFDLAIRQDYVLVDLFLHVLDTRRRWVIACDSVYWDYFMVPKEKLREFEQKLLPQAL